MPVCSAAVSRVLRHVFHPPYLNCIYFATLNYKETSLERIEFDYRETSLVSSKDWEEAILPGNASHLVSLHTWSRYEEKDLNMGSTVHRVIRKIWTAISNSESDYHNFLLYIGYAYLIIYNWESCCVAKFWKKYITVLEGILYSLHRFPIFVVFSIMDMKRNDEQPYFFIHCIFIGYL